MRDRSWIQWIGLLGGGYLLGPGGCIPAFQRELEVLLAFDALGNALLLRESVVVDLFGPTLLGVLQFFR